MKMELAHSNKSRSIEREKVEIEKDKAQLEKKLEGNQCTSHDIDLFSSFCCTGEPGYVGPIGFSLLCYIKGLKL